MFASLVSEWRVDPNYSHGFLIPLMSLYLVWERKQKLKACKFSPSNVGFVFLICGLLMFFAGKLAAENFLMRFSFIIVLSSLILFLYGKDHLRVLAFPVLFLVFMIPVPSIIMNRITFPLQLVASKLATHSIQLLGIPVLQEGNIIRLGGLSLEVAKACSGIRSLMSLLALGTVYAYFTSKSMTSRVVIVLSTIPIAIMVNSLRITMTAFLSVHYGTKAAEGFIHEFSGVLLFLVAVILLILTSFTVSQFSKLKNRLNGI